MPSSDDVISELSVLIQSHLVASSFDELSCACDDSKIVLFKAQFLGLEDDGTPLNLGMAELRASEASAAMWEAISMPWPPQAIGFQLLDVSDPIIGKRPTWS